MRLSASEKEDIILLVERSELGVNRTLKQLGIPKTTFYKWYNIYTEKGLVGLENKNPGNRRQWNSIPQEEKNLVVSVALEFTDLSPRELSCKLSDERKVFISESSVYRILKTNGLITSPAHILLAAGNEFEKKTMSNNSTIANLTVEVYEINTIIKSTYAHYIIFGSTFLGLLWAAFNFWIVSVHLSA